MLVHAVSFFQPEPGQRRAGLAEFFRETRQETFKLHSAELAGDGQTRIRILP
jgi:hypothetical protein